MIAEPREDRRICANCTRRMSTAPDATCSRCGWQRGPKIAAPVWVCGACGKEAASRGGLGSCLCHGVQCWPTKDAAGRWVPVKGNADPGSEAGR